MMSSVQPSRLAGEICVQVLICGSPDEQLRIYTSVLSKISAGESDGAASVKKKKNQKGARH